MTPPPAPRRTEPTQHLRTVLVYALGLWPLTAVVLLACGLLIMAGNSGAP
jgi:nitrate reductase NapE component